MKFLSFNAKLTFLRTENQRKKEARDDRIRKERKDACAKAKDQREANNKTIRSRLAQYRKEDEQSARDFVNSKRQARQRRQIYVEAEPRVALVVRIKGIHHHAPRVRKILQLFRLRQINNATFVKLNKATLNMLQQVGYCVAWGYPSKQTVRNLIYARGYGRVNGQRIPLTCNEIVQNSLGKLDMLCVEDVVHEIHTCGKNFKQANNFLWPFKLSSAKGGNRRKNHSYINGGMWGNREDKINHLVKKMM